jgi:hypothetical protein
MPLAVRRHGLGSTQHHRRRQVIHDGTGWADTASYRPLGTDRRAWPLTRVATDEPALPIVRGDATLSDWSRTRSRPDTRGEQALQQDATA